MAVLQSLEELLADKQTTPAPNPAQAHPTPYTLQPTPYTLHPTPYTLHPTTVLALFLGSLGEPWGGTARTLTDVYRMPSLSIENTGVLRS